MNLTQWILITIPFVAAYVWFVFNAETEGSVHRRSNAVMGLFAIPLATIFVPALALQAAKEGFKKRKYGVMVGAMVALVVFFGYGVVIYAFGDRTSPVSAELPLPVEVPLER